MALIILVPEPQLMMPRVLRCDLDGVRQLLHQLESDSSSKYNVTQLLKKITYNFQVYSKM